MSDLIHLLPDNIANQIAAGEVIQRPASAVKELLENAVDAGATDIKLIINDAGKSLVQVIDNGKGMSTTDARMCFERHATSKISNIDDLFRIRTMGFRGEALASIAAVAQVELKTRRSEDQLGTYIEIENSQVKIQEPCAAPAGTSFSMKNLFFNVPARRNFLKSNAVETRHIVDEFIHVALAFPGIFFSLNSNGYEIFHLEKGTLKQRIIQILGNQYTSKIVPVGEKTDYLNISGFVGKPEAGKKTRGDQYLFVNNRFIRSPYLNHAIMNAYQDMIAPNTFPLYVLFIDLDPAQVDINVHPTKQEIKFEDEKIIYAFVQAAVKHGLAQYSITPTLDFDLDPAIQNLEAVSKPFTQDKQAAASASHLFKSFTQKHQAHRIESNEELQNWRSFFSGNNETPATDKTGNDLVPETSVSSTGLFETVREKRNHLFEGVQDAPLMQIDQSYILVQANRGFILINQSLAHERILYERFSEAVSKKNMATQKSLFPSTVTFSPADAALFSDLVNDLNELGYLLESFGRNSWIIQGTPAETDSGNETATIEKILEQYKFFNPDIKCSKKEKLVRSMAIQQSIKTGTSLSEKEMRKIVEELSECHQPNTTVNGQPTYIEFGRSYLEKLFLKQSY